MSATVRIQSADGVLAEDGIGNILIAAGTTVPSDAASGYATGCIFMQTDGDDGSAVYINEGSSTSAAFEPIGGTAATTQVLTFNGATGANEIVVPANLADALSLESSAGDIIVVDTTTSAVAVTITTSAAAGLTLAGHTTVGDAKNVILNTTTGTKIGTAVGQKLGFWNATPVVQQAAAAQGALTNSTGGSADATLEAVGDTMAGNQAAAINNNFTELHTLLNAIRTALVNTGIIKGAA